MAAGQRTLLVGNPTARTGKAERFIRAAMARMAERGLDPEFLATRPEGATVGALCERLLKGGVARVVYLGGDGTFAEAAKGILEARSAGLDDVPLGMLPMGTANDQGRSYGISSGEGALPKNIETIAADHREALDVGEVEVYDRQGTQLQHDRFFDSFGVGLSAEILAARNEDRRSVAKLPLLRHIYRDKAVYVGAALRNIGASMLEGAYFPVTVTVDGKTQRYPRATDVLIQGTILYAGDWIFDPNARGDDGVFETVIFRSHRDWTRAALRGHKRNPLRSAHPGLLRGAEIEIQLDLKDAALPRAQIDGEEFRTGMRFVVRNLARALTIITPEGNRWI